LALAVYDPDAASGAHDVKRHHGGDFLPAWLLVYASLLLFALALALLHKLVRAALPADTASADALYFGSLIAPATAGADGDGPAAPKLAPVLRDVLVAPSAAGPVAGPASSGAKTPMGVLGGLRPYGRKQ
jgi:hypothetical protein